MPRNAQGLTVDRTSVKAESSAQWLSEEREALIFVDTINKLCILVHMIVLDKLVWSTLYSSCSQPEKPACTSHLHTASLCSGIQRKVYIIPHRGADVCFPEQQ